MQPATMDHLAQRIATRLTRRTGLGLLAGAVLPFLGLAEATDAKKKKKKKITLCFNGQTVKKPKNKAKKLLKQGATKGACPDRCPSNQKLCGDDCIPVGNCCVDDDCTGSDTCVNGECAPLRCGFPGGPCAVFVTKDPFIGTAIGGVEGGDAICQTAANNAGMSGRFFMAWLSTATQSPLTRFTPAGPYVLVRNASDGNNPPPTVADDFNDLITCNGNGGACLRSPINRDETGNTDVSTEVWTGTDETGNPETDTCANWTNGGVNGQIGATNSVSSTWTSAAAVSCGGGSRSLYCFEQSP